MSESQIFFIQTCFVIWVIHIQTLYGGEKYFRVAVYNDVLKVDHYELDSANFNEKSAKK